MQKNYLIAIFLILLSCINNVCFSQNISDGLVAKYLFNGDANDEVGINNGVVFGATPSKDRFNSINSAFQFDGVNDYIQIISNNILNFEYNQDFTISVWVYINETQNDLNGNNNDILGKWNSQTDTSYPYAIRFWNINATEERQNKIFSLRYDSQFCSHNPFITGNCSISREFWHHLVFLKNGNLLEYYQDGLLFGSITDNTVLSCNTVNNEPILIGRRTLGGRFFTGKIDDLYFYDRALSFTEINMLLNLNGWVPQNVPTYIFTQFEISEQLESNIDTINKNIKIVVPCYSDITKLTPTFSATDGATVKIGDIIQTSEISENDFSNPVIYTIENKENCISEDWLVTVELNKATEDEIINSTKILSYSIPTQIGQSVISNDSSKITIILPCNTDFTNLESNFTIPANSIAILENEQQVNSSIRINYTTPLFLKIKTSNKCYSRVWQINVISKELAIETLDLSNQNYFIPNVITPNYDGKNDYFKVGNYFLNSRLNIFNRLGIKVYKSEAYKNNFGGTNLPSGQYYYLLSSRCFTNDIKGTLTILK